MSKLIINSASPVTLKTEVGELKIHGHNAITEVTDEQYQALMKKADFKNWIEKGYIICDVPLKRVNEVKKAQDEKDIAKQETSKAEAKLEALTDAIMVNEGISNRADAEAEARKRLNQEADKAEQGGDSDASELRASAKAKGKATKYNKGYNDRARTKLFNIF